MSQSERPSARAEYVSPETVEEKLVQCDQVLKHVLEETERAVAIFRSRFGFFLTTDRRLFAVNLVWRRKPSAAVKKSVRFTDVSAIRAKTATRGKATVAILEIERRTGGVEKYSIDPDEAEEAAAWVQLAMEESGVSAEVESEHWAGSGWKKTSDADRAAQQDLRRRSVEISRVPFLGDKVNNPVRDEILKSCRVGELPRWVVGSTGAGALVAFDDRCMIIKKGVMTNMLAGSFGGGRVATFLYTEITGIEYNAGLLNGVVEILTPSYQGNANKDFWKGSTAGRNKDSNDPFTLSNTLPLSKLLYERVRPQINELKQLVAGAKRVVVNAPVASSSGSESIATELAKLGKLHQEGVLNEAEFTAAKEAVLRRAR